MITAEGVRDLDDVIADLLADPSAVPDTLAGQPGWWQSLAHGALGIALLHAERAGAGLGSWRRARDWLAAATRSPVAAGAGSHLFHGAPALAYVLSRAAACGWTGGERTMSLLDGAIVREVAVRTGRAHARIDTGELPDLAEFDLIRGLTGSGAYLLRRAPSSDSLRDVLEYLVRLTEPAVADGVLVPGWWTPVSPSGQRTTRFAGGHANLGMAHGIGGPLALLSLAVRHGVTVDGQLAAICRMCSWLADWQSSDPTRPGWPYWIDLPSHRHGQRPGCWPQRLGWCYGTAGLARAIQLASIATGDPGLRSIAETALIIAVEGQAVTHDLSLCHGQTGLALIATAVADDASSEGIATQLRRFAGDQLDAIRVRHDDLAHGSPGLGFLDGAAGIALAFTSRRAGTSSGWAACLLIT